MLHRGLSILVSVSLLCFGTACGRSPQFPPDDAKAAGLTAADFPQAAADVFKEMDGGIPLGEDEIRGRNTWILWTAGNQVFWDRLAREGYGIVDLLKTLDSRRRPNRFAAKSSVQNGEDVGSRWAATGAGHIPKGVYRSPLGTHRLVPRGKDWRH